MIRWLRNRLGLCPHDVTYRERRTVDDVEHVMCLVCQDCGSSWPCVWRPASKHREMLQAGRVIPSKAKRKPADVVDIRRAR